MDNLDEIKRQIQNARDYGLKVHKNRARLAGFLSSAFDVDVDVEFPGPDIMHVYSRIFGVKEKIPAVYRLSFGEPLKWIGISHPWGLKPADISIPENWTLTTSED